MARSRLPNDDTIMLAAQLRTAEDAIAAEILNDAIQFFHLKNSFLTSLH
jgi:hypothetical protein